MNAYLLDDIFLQDQAREELKFAQCAKLAKIMADMLRAKLAREFPEKQFLVVVTDDVDDFGVSFHQT